MKNKKVTGVRVDEILFDQLGVVNYGESVKKAGFDGFKAARSFYVKRGDGTHSDRYLYNSANYVRSRLFENSFPRMPATQEISRWQHKLTTNVDALLRGFMFAETESTVKKDSCIYIDKMVSKVPNTIEAELKTSSAPNENIDDDGKPTGGKTLFIGETSRKTEMATSIHIDLKKMQFAPQSEQMRMLSFGGVVNGKDITVEDATSMVNESLKEIGVSNGASFGKYTPVGSAVPLVLTGVKMSEEAMIALIKRVFELVTKIRDVKSSGSLKYKKMSDVVLEFSDGSDVSVSLDSLESELKKYGIKEFFEKSEETEAQVLFSKAVADQKKADRLEEKKQKAEEKKAKKAKKASSET